MTLTNQLLLFSYVFFLSFWYILDFWKKKFECSNVSGWDPMLDKKFIHAFTQWTLYEWLHLSIKSNWCKCIYTCAWPFDLLTPVAFADCSPIAVCQWSNTVHVLQNGSLLRPLILCVDFKSLFRPHVPIEDWPCACPDPPPPKKKTLLKIQNN